MVRGKAALPGMAWQGYYLDTEGTPSGSTRPTRTPADPPPTAGALGTPGALGVGSGSALRDRPHARHHAGTHDDARDPDGSTDTRQHPSGGGPPPRGHGPEPHRERRSGARLAGVSLVLLTLVSGPRSRPAGVRDGPRRGDDPARPRAGLPRRRGPRRRRRVGPARHAPPQGDAGLHRPAREPQRLRGPPRGVRGRPRLAGGRGDDGLRAGLGGRPHRVRPPPRHRGHRPLALPARPAAVAVVTAVAGLAYLADALLTRATETSAAAVLVPLMLGELVLMGWLLHASRTVADRKGPGSRHHR